MSLRAEVAATGRELLRLGLVAGTSGNVSAREGDVVHITPAGLPYPDMGEADIVTLDLEGAVVGGARAPSSERRVHLAVYAARPDARALVHTHSVHATAWSFLGRPLELDTEELEQAAGGPVRTAHHAPTGSEQIAAAAVEALGDRDAVLLGRHGVLALGASLAGALDTAAVVERAAQMAWLLRSA